jgi:aryl-alcohol dehydrogenase-like predicted oxidoreductase
MAVWEGTAGLQACPLQGKYLEGGPSEARLNKYRGRYAEAESRYGNKPNTISAVRAYAHLATQAGMSPASLAVRYELAS